MGQYEPADKAIWKRAWRYSIARLHRRKLCTRFVLSRRWRTLWQQTWYTLFPWMACKVLIPSKSQSIIPTKSTKYSIPSLTTRAHRLFACCVISLARMFLTGDWQWVSIYPPNHDHRLPKSPLTSLRLLIYHRRYHPHNHYYRRRCHHHFQLPLIVFVVVLGERTNTVLSNCSCCSATWTSTSTATPRPMICGKNSGR